MHMDTIRLVGPLILAAAIWRGVQALLPEPSVPAHVTALVGSCVVIPCSFTPAPPHPLRGSRERVDVRLQFRGGGRLFSLRSTAFNSEDRSQVSRDFLGRASLFGRIAEGDCSVKIERISLDDLRHFEVALKRGVDSLWGRPRTFSLNVVATPPAPVVSGVSSATEGQQVTMNCTTSYHCPSRPPTLQWHWGPGVQLRGSKSQEVQTLYPEPHKPMLLAPLSFNVSHQAKPNLRCVVNYPGAAPVATAKDLHVTFAPKDVRIQVQTMRVQEGGSALLVCSCKADPPASEYRWSYYQHGQTVQIQRRTHTVRVYNVTRDMRVHCSAQNLIGRGESPPTPLNVQYKPVIQRISSMCVAEDLEVICHCSVDSNPRPAITWSVNGTVPPHNYNISVISQPAMLTAVLRGHMDKPQTVICFAVNAVGNDSLTLLQEEEETEVLLWTVVSAGTLSLVIFLLSLLFFCCRKKSRNHALRRRPAVYPGGMGIYQEKMPLYINCAEVTHIYANGSYQLVYQNCTPLFVRTKQIRPIARRGGERRLGERRRGGEGERMDRRNELGVRGMREVRSPAMADAEAAIYLEIL